MKYVLQIEDILNKMSGDEKRDLIDYLACEDTVIACVCEQVIDGFTSNISRGASRSSFFPRANNFILDAVRRYIADKSSQVTEQILNEAERKVEKLEKENLDYRAKIDALEMQIERFKELLEVKKPSCSYPMPDLFLEEAGLPPKKGGENS